jgi:hypothetical protein
LASAEISPTDLRQIKIANSPLGQDPFVVSPPVSGALVGSPKIRKGLNMPQNHAQLDQMQKAYIAAVEKWIAAIKQEEALASVNHTIAEVDKWEKAHFKEDEIRNSVKAAKKKYEDALREEFFGF